MKTVTVQIGNSDDKLTQSQWSSYVASTRSTINEFATAVHFFGAPSNYEQWQNVCWVVELDGVKIQDFFKELKRERKAFHQESVAVTVGETQLI